MIHLEQNLEMPVSQVLKMIQDRTINGSTYFGIKAIKNPLDFWIYQEIIFKIKPDVIIEIGNFCGGSTLALAHLCDCLDHGRVIGLDLSHQHVPQVVKEHPRITLIEGDACELFERVKKLIEDEESVLIIEDSSHTFDNTLKVLRTYSPLVKPGGYFIVEDSVCNHGLEAGPNPGSYEAIEAFVNENNYFEIDRSKESFFITWNIKGFLKRREQPREIGTLLNKAYTQEVDRPEGSYVGMSAFWGAIVKPLLEVIQAKTIVEVGAFEGQNTANLLTYCAEQQGYLHVIDPLLLFDAEAYQQKFGPIFSMHQNLSLNVLAGLGRFEAILLDGDHNWYTVFNELQQIQAIHQDDLQAYPLIFMHDIGWPWGRRDVYHHPETIPAEYRYNYRKANIAPIQSVLAAGSDSNKQLYPEFYIATSEGGGRNGVLTAVEDFMAQSSLDFEFITIPANFGLGILVTSQRLQNNPPLRRCLDELKAVHLADSLPNPHEDVKLRIALRASLPYHLNLHSSLAQNFFKPKMDSQATKVKSKPKFSIIVVVYNMRREAERTLYSLSAQYQQEVDEADYEVIVVENGSTEPLENTDLTRFGGNFKYHYLPNAPKSPVQAINVGVKMAQGDYLGIMIDGAHLLTPGVLKYAQLGFQLFKNPIIAIRYCFLGPDQQNLAILGGYNKQVEDALLNKIGWPENGYRLFEIGELIGKPRWDWFEPLLESNCLFINRQVFADLGGYDTKFDLPAGGFANADFFVRAIKRQDTTLVVILGEASFHQIHDGTTTNAHPAEVERLTEQYYKQYLAIRGTQFALPDVPLHFIGHMSPQAILSFDRVRNREYDIVCKEMHTKEKEINHLAQICTDREALINQLSAVCTDRETLINQLSAVCTDREALINQLYDIVCKERHTKEKEINHLAQICADREALINQLSAVCTDRETLINQLSAVCTDREALINQLSVICTEREARINQLS